MIQNLPLDIKAESLLAYIPRTKRKLEIVGSHKRNAYEDISDVSVDEDGVYTLALSRDGIYDILPECLFHPVDRFDNIPANEYKERFTEECEQQQIEAENARKFFHPFDTFLIELGTLVNDLKNDGKIESVLKDIICDSLPQQYKENRFVKKAKEFMPQCKIIRGNKGLFTLMLRHILFDENLVINERIESIEVNDASPRYNYRLDDSACEDSAIYLGNEFEETIMIYDIHYWNDDECDESFLKFIADIKIFEDFLNEFFIGVESLLRFEVSTVSLPVRLSDDVSFNYLDYNTNI